MGDNDGPVKGRWKAAIVPFILVVIIHYFIYPITGIEGVVILTMIPVTVLCTRILYKKGHITVTVNRQNR